jgi:Ca2+-binding RTX toxin-like protein
MAKIKGTNKNNTLKGTNSADSIFGFGGNDKLFGKNGNDKLDGGKGNDILDGGKGADKMKGGAGNDTFIVDNAGDTVSDASGIDIVKSSVTHTLAANIENLTLTGFAAINGTGNELGNIITGNAGANTLDGGAGNDALTGGAGIDTFNVTAGTDTITDLGLGGLEEGLTVSAGATVNATAAADWDTLSGLVSNSGTATIFASGHIINLSSALGTNGWTITNAGNAAGVSFRGSVNDDTLIGGDGNDSFDADLGNNTLTCGAGVDEFRFFGVGTDTITDLGAGGADIIEVFANSSVNATAAANWTAPAATYNDGKATITANGHNIDVSAAGGTNGWTITNAGNATGVTLTGSAKNDTLTGGNGEDTLTGGDGDDILFGSTSGNDKLTGGAGVDTFYIDASSHTITDLGFGGADVFQVYALSANATAAADWTASALTLNNSFASITANGHNIDVSAAIGNNGWTITNEGNATGVTIGGSAQNDFLEGGDAIDLLGGNGGDDTIIGGANADILTGGLGIDTFIYRDVSDSGLTDPTRDLISDFVSGTDKIDLSAIDADVSVAGDQAFGFEANSTAVNNLLGGSVGFFQDIGNGVTIVHLELAGDLNFNADFTIRLSGIFDLTAADFNL